MVVIVRLPLGAVVEHPVELAAARARRRVAQRNTGLAHCRKARRQHPQHHHQRPGDQRHDRNQDRAVFHRSSPLIEGRTVLQNSGRRNQSNNLAKRRFSRLRQAPRCQASLVSSGRTLVASVNTICSWAVSTLPQLHASCSVEDEQAPSRTSATVIWTAYLCISTSS